MAEGERTGRNRKERQREMGKTHAQTLKKEVCVGCLRPRSHAPAPSVLFPMTLGFPSAWASSDKLAVVLSPSPIPTTSRAFGPSDANAAAGEKMLVWVA